MGLILIRVTEDVGVDVSVRKPFYFYFIRIITVIHGLR